MDTEAFYHQITSEQLEELKLLDAEELYNTFLEMQDDVNMYELGVCWDTIHFVLTGVTASEPIEGDLLSEAIVGTSLFDEDGEFIAYTLLPRVKEISQAMSETDFEALLSRNFSARALEMNDIYPGDFWLCDEERLKENLTEYFTELKEFYAFAAENDFAVVLGIY